ncbi:hypothetical protein PS914_00702 [Pseudomonas fluorescens]|uniref:1-acyl-sn-glycerol-3-phosphate acyltransferase n=1 Tax=Pseudomonas fluorescens TaxID=294 RepID=UPI001240ABB1|nr:hypothetical protein PS914_00702 [Pseudomonas fluorescens]
MKNNLVHHEAIDSPGLAKKFGIKCKPNSTLQLTLDILLGVFKFAKIHSRADLTNKLHDTSTKIKSIRRILSINYRIILGSSSSVGRTGDPLIIVANHPFGLVDSLIALEIALDHRPDVIVLTNIMLSYTRLSSEHISWVDTSPSGRGSSVNIKSLRRCLKHLRGGGCLLLFPAGACSHLQRLETGWKIEDTEWHSHLGRITQQTKTNIIPFYFHGRNSTVFCIGGFISSTFRSLMLLRELFNKQGQTINLTIGRRFDHKELIGTPTEITNNLRSYVYSLKHQELT